MSEQKTNAVAKRENVQVSFRPVGSTEDVTLTLGMVRKYVANPTRSGQVPSDRDIVGFMMLCQARKLNPWEGDAYLVGYDSKDGPQFSLITGINTMMKRAEANKMYRGIESGVIVADQDGEMHDITGEVYDDSKYRLVGGWARVVREDRDTPFEARVKFKTYDTQRSRWAKDPEGMIVKVARAHALREAFPTATGGLYTDDEMEHIGPDNAKRIAVTDVSAEDMVDDETPEPSAGKPVVPVKKEKESVQESGEDEEKPDAAVASDDVDVERGDAYEGDLDPKSEPAPEQKEDDEPPRRRSRKPAIKRPGAGRATQEELV